MCRAHATVRGLMGELVEGAEDVAVADLEAGLENFSRGTPRHSDAVLAVLEPYYRSLETGARTLELARELEIPGVHAVVNKVRNAEDREAVEAFCRSRGIEPIGSVPFDEAIVAADREGVALLDRAPGCDAVRAVEAIADRLKA